MQIVWNVNGSVDKKASGAHSHTHFFVAAFVSQSQSWVGAARPHGLQNFPYLLSGPLEKELPISALREDWLSTVLNAAVVHSCFLCSLPHHSVNLQLWYISSPWIPAPLSFQEWPHAILLGFLSEWQVFSPWQPSFWRLLPEDTDLPGLRRVLLWFPKLFCVLSSLTLRESFLPGGSPKSSLSLGCLILST